MGRPAVSLENRFWSRVNKTSTCWLWTMGTDKDGYGKISSGKRQNRKHMRAHRVSYELYKGAVPDGMFVCHTCDNPSCVNPEHLFLGTAFDNNRDTINKGRRKNPKGVNHWARRVKQVRDKHGKFSKIE